LFERKTIWKGKVMSSPPEPTLHDWSLDQPAIDAFQNVLNKSAPGAIAVATLASRFSDWDPSRQALILDERALLSAICVYATRSNENAAVSLMNGLSRLKLVPNMELLDRKARSKQMLPPSSSAIKIELSDGLQNIILPRALEIATKTVNRPFIDLRHLVMAFLDTSSPMSEFLEQSLSGNMLHSLRSEIVEPLESNRETGENIEAWRQLVDKTSLILEAENEPSAITEPDVPTPKFNRMALQLGDPAQIDLLDRKPFAEILGDRIKEVYAGLDSTGSRSDDRAFIIHLHGPWGLGKSTLLNFVKDHLEKESVKDKTDGWLVVDFNAWKYQRLKPPWWTLMGQIQHAAQQRDLQGFKKLSMKFVSEWLKSHGQWLWMRFRLGTLSTQAGAIALGLASMLGYFWVTTPSSDADLTKTLVAGAGLVTAVYGVANIFRSLFSKPDTVTKAQSELTEDPYRKVVKQFSVLIKSIKRPIIVFIDDLDRCEASYVVELLENIQTMLRATPIVYLVAADRDWITTSFTKRYVDFTNQAKDPARPLGYLFLDKLFQLSVDLPSFSSPIRQRFFDAVLNEQQVGEQLKSLPTAEEIIQANQSIETLTSPIELQAAIDAVPEDTTKKAAIRQAVARRVLQPETIQATEHRLSHLAPLLDPNPRAIKNLISSVAINQSKLVLEGRRFDLEHLARWSIIELRWPLLANWLREDPSRIENTTSQFEEAEPNTKAMISLINSLKFRAITSGHLTSDIVRNLVG
jgi:Cdc6-like AAA superfamily ATPase